MRFGPPAWYAILVIFLGTLPCSMNAQHREQKRVLLLFSEYGQRREFLEPFEASVRAHVKADITFDETYMEGPLRVELESYQDSEAETLRRRFAGEKLDLVVAVGPTALLFTVRYRERMFSGVPVVFVGVSSDQFRGQTWPGVTGVANHIGLGETIDLALHLQPDTKAVAVISPNDPPWLAATHAELSRYSERVREIDFIGPPGPELFEKVAALPPHTVVLFDLALNPGQPPLAGFDLLDAVAERIPTYSAWPNLCLNHGCIGGAFEVPTRINEQGAEVAARVLSGEPVDRIPIEQVVGLQVSVDSRALQHWHIPESALPPGSLVLFREPTLWERGRQYFLAAIAVIVVQSLLIFALFWQRARRRKAEIELGKSEEKFSKAFQHSPLAVTIVRATDDRYIEVNEVFEVDTGWLRDEVRGRTPLEIGLWVDPDQRAAFLTQLLKKGNVKDFELRFRRRDGQVRTGRGSAELIELNGEQCSLSVIADITERKQAEEAMASVSSRLIEAQEAERTRIARELHDDINQRLAMVAIIMESTKQDLPASEIETNRQLEKATAQISELGDDIQALAHRLHSPRLEYLGLEVAASGFCSEMSERQNVEINFRYGDIPEVFSDQISLCLFRVLQEALHNAVKYSGASEFDVSLTGTSGEIELRVHDAGVGFDPRETSKGHGLGLISMKERLKLVRGELSIDSRPGHGTTVLARVPLDCEKTGPAEEKPLDLANQGVPQH